MTLSMETKIDRIEVVNDFSIQVRTALRIFQNGAELTTTHHRHVVTPDSDLTVEDPRVRAVAEAAFTDEVRAAWGATKAAIG